MKSKVNLRLMLFFISSTLVFGAMAQGQLPGAVGGYQLVFQDDFCGPTLNEAVWNIEVNGDGGGNAELQYYRRENVSIENAPTGESSLVLTAKRETYSGRQFTSGRVTTKDKMIFKYGKIEARIRVPNVARGLWPAFWMMGNTPQNANGSVQWPRCGEIDIFEMGQNVNDPENVWGGHFHYGNDFNGGAYPNWGSGTQRTNPIYSVQNTWTLWTVTWDENSIKMYIDLDKYPNRAPYLQWNGDITEFFRK